MKLANLFLNFETFTPPLETYKLSKLSSAKLLKKYRCEIPLYKFVNTTKFVKIKEVSFKSGYVIQVGKEIDETPKFALIIEIILNDKDILLGCQKLTNIKFDQFY